jgi:hypothetical protein
MGLDITAYEKVELVRPRPEGGYTDAEYDDDTKITLYVEEHFAAAADGLISGLYTTSGKRHGFRAGSYGGYNTWRRMLAALVGTTPRDVRNDPKPGPFVELINNSDVEGAIGPLTSAKLARDFAEWQSRADAFEPETGVHGDGDDLARSFRERYAEWRKAFELAAGSGAVELH